MKKILSICAVLVINTVSSCNKSQEIPYSLENILERNEVTASGAGGGAGGGNGSVSYQGPGAAMVRQLLGSVSGWQTPSCLTCSGAVPPDVAVGAYCIRDTYVAAAINYAWAAESYYRLGENSQAASMAAQMQEQLNNANMLCSDAPGVGGGDCKTFDLYRCP